MPMNHSKKSDEWIAAVVAANPIKLAANGQIITCPVRLQFADLFHFAKPMRGEAPDPNKPPKYGCTPLFPPGSMEGINSVIRPKALELARSTFPDRFDPETGEPRGLHFPFRSQDEKIEQQGFTRGLLFCNVTTRFKPQIVDTAMNEITDESRVYNGVWAILALNFYTFNDVRKKGIGLGLQMAMIFADDTKLLSKTADPKTAFAGVKIDSAFNPDEAFGTGSTKTPTKPEPSAGLW